MCVWERNPVLIWPEEEEAYVMLPRRGGHHSYLTTVSQPLIWAIFRYEGKKNNPWHHGAYRLGWTIMAKWIITNFNQKAEPLHAYKHIYIRLCICCCCLVTKSCLTLCDPMDCSPPGSSVGEMSQARGTHSRNQWELEWVPILFSKGSSPRGQIWVSCITGRFFTSVLPVKPQACMYVYELGCICMYV